MDALSHYHLSQDYAAKAARFLDYMGRTHRDDMMVAFAECSVLAELAQAHATLALAGATAIRPTDPTWEPRWDDLQAWRQAASVVAPISPETDDEDEPEDDAVRVGSVSPADPAELVAWLLALPLRTILRDRTWNPCQRDTGVEHLHRAPNRQFDALFVVGTPFELAEGHDRLPELAAFAPFTVLALGDGAEA